MSTRSLGVILAAMLAACEAGDGSAAGGATDAGPACRRTNFPAEAWYACVYSTATGALVAEEALPVLERAFAGEVRSPLVEARRTLALEPGFYVFEAVTDGDLSVAVGADGERVLDTSGWDSDAPVSSTPVEVSGPVRVLARFLARGDDGRFAVSWRQVPAPDAGTPPDEVPPPPDGTPTDPADDEPQPVPRALAVGGQARVTAYPSLRLRAGPSTASEIRSELPCGTTVALTQAPQDGFWGVTWNTRPGYAFGQYLVHPDDFDPAECGAPPDATSSGELLPCAHAAAILRWGLHPGASDRLRCAGIGASRISQTIGSAAASAGTHAKDGTAAGHDYSAATDLRAVGWSDAQVKGVLATLTSHGFAPFFRNPGQDGWPAGEARHFHVIYAGVPMKASLRDQVRDWLDGRNGLRSHAAYRFWQATPAQKATIRALFEAAN